MLTNYLKERLKGVKTLKKISREIYFWSLRPNYSEASSEYVGELIKLHDTTMYNGKTLL